MNVKVKHPPLPQCLNSILITLHATLNRYSFSFFPSTNWTLLLRWKKKLNSIRLKFYRWKFCFCTLVIPLYVKIRRDVRKRKVFLLYYYTQIQVYLKIIVNAFLKITSFCIVYWNLFIGINGNCHLVTAWKEYENRSHQLKGMNNLWPAGQFWPTYLLKLARKCN